MVAKGVEDIIDEILNSRRRNDCGEKSRFANCILCTLIITNVDSIDSIVECRIEPVGNV